MNGTYKLSFTGTAEVCLDWTSGYVTHQSYNDVTNPTTAEIVIDSADKSNLILGFRRTNGGVKNVELIRPGYSGTETFIDGAPVGTVSLASTGGGDQSSTPVVVSLEVGLHSIRLQSSRGQFNVRSLQIEVAASPTPTPSATPTASPFPTATPTPMPSDDATRPAWTMTHRRPEFTCPYHFQVRP